MPNASPVGRWTAWTVLAATALLTVGAVVAWAVAAPPYTATQLYSLVDLLDGVVYGVVAWLILGRQRTGSRLPGWITAAAALGSALAAFAAQWHLAAGGPPLLTALHDWAWVPGLYALVVVMPWLLPDRPPRRLDRIATATGLGYLAVTVLALATAPPPVGVLPLTPELREARAALLRPLAPVLSYALVGLGLLAGAGLAWRWRRGPARQRHGLGWATAGSTLLTLAFGVTLLPPVLPAVVPALLMLASQAFFPAAVAVVVLRQQLWGLRLAVRRTLVWYLMTAGVIAAYCLAVALLDRLLPPAAPVPQLVVTGVLAAAFQPVRVVVQRRVDRLVHGEAPEPLLHQVVHSVGRTTDIGATVAAALRLAEVRITEDGPQPPPHEHGPPLTVPLTSGERPVGYLHAWPRPGELLGARAAESLAVLAPVVAAVVDLARTNRDLARSRQRLAEVRDEERKSLRRDLHDGLGPALSGIGLGLAATRNLLRRDPDRAEGLLDRLTDELTARAAEVRELAHGLLPPVLADGGLGPALDLLRDQYARAGLRIVLHGPDTMEPLPERIATAAYGVAAEAIRNVQRHAGVDSCTVSLDQRPDRLRVTVTDHGRGLPASPTGAGVGLHAMRERAQAVGATLTLGPAGPRGTAVCLTIPLEQP
ncbi:sensor histidine kinase [Micromonospora sp. WMMD998]|uniref:sensor histidine kinase n=1 Tax=Micromonospora sp. WMMD998 TaxID=3016092 RepID=UPI002499BB9C|nr:sensor histidine kinase [Micromonospora sp. WMMD998]WFE39936.1 sensor histidine kinase [Micromonospora sp. WMMD998]